MRLQDKIILDLCGGTGSWGKPYKEAGYDYRNITLPDYDLTEEMTVKYCISLNPYGILFACPCDIWSNAGVKHWKQRTPDQVLLHAEILVKGLRIIYNTQPVFWCLENPIGKMKEFMGEPNYKFHPYQWGDAYTKKTYLWGKFSMPIFEKTVEPVIIKPTLYGGSKSTKNHTPISWISGKDRKEKRAITPQGFAKAFFEANQ